MLVWLKKRVKPAAPVDDDDIQFCCCSRRALRRACKVLGLLSLATGLLALIFWGVMTIGVESGDLNRILAEVNNCTGGLVKCDSLEIYNGYNASCQSQFCTADCASLPRGQSTVKCEFIEPVGACLFREDCDSAYITFRTKVSRDRKRVQVVAMSIFITCALLVIIAFLTRRYVRWCYHWLNGIEDEFIDDDEDDDFERNHMKYVKRMTDVER